MYGATAAPGATLWDAGELIAAVHSAGIPHPPGTPLWMLAARAWRLALSPLPTALATNLFSAACTAAAGGVLAWLLARWLRAPVAGAAGAICAGAMSTVWLNATETEVYAAALLLSMAMLACGERAGATGDGRWRLLLAYEMALAVPVHLSALVAAPAAIVLASSTRDRWRVRDGVMLLGALGVAAGAGLARWPVVAAGAALACGAALSGERHERGARGAWLAAAIAVMALALSALAVLSIRAAHAPVLDAGHPVTWRALWEVVGRRQYGVHGPWPRQAPLWAQLGNLAEYADWQVALGLAPGVAPSWRRTPVTVAYVALAAYGAVRHRALDRRSFRAMLLLLLCASVGLVLYMNFKAGASFGYGVLPDDAAHEVRERDYFFALAFWTWGAWAGAGAVLLARRWGGALVPAGVAVAVLPLALGWRAVDRSRGPERDIAHRVGSALLWSAPTGAVLVTGGDNDSFPLWYAQVVEGARRDVTVVTVPLLGAGWYRAQLARRDGLVDPADTAAPPPERVLLSRIAARARARGRAVAVAVTAGERVRDELGGTWTLRGLAWVRPRFARDTARLAGSDVVVDTAAALAFAHRFGEAGGAAGMGDLTQAIDPAPIVMGELLECPARWLAAVRARVRVDSLDSSCKWR
ncbi:MAG TPA: DUF2723 domain-containing protein [Gemmatimonadaceae bacterium]|nr:DUF2723 domain-containing protein [Gemmatimonadaceae bacterium]